MFSTRQFPLRVNVTVPVESCSPAPWVSSGENGLVVCLWDISRKTVPLATPAKS